ncbi:MAG: pantetheine-phosphate adenylyltransferase [Nonlabens sp.]
MKRAIFPGSFDPITLGHVDIIKRGLKIFDEIIVAIGVNATKKYMFPLEQRVQFIEATFKNEQKLVVKTYEGLTTEFCKAQQAGFILRGLRNAIDFEYENSIAQANHQLSGIETVTLFTSTEYSFISSSIVRDVMRNDGDYRLFVPDPVQL